jgi:V/A-type H+-transporting ATPase subunit C
MDRTIFAQSVSRIRFLETRMLNKAKLEALIESRDFWDCLRLLQDSIYSEYILGASYEEGLKTALQNLYRDMYKTSPLKELIDVLAIRYDAHNIKALIKSRVSSMDTRGILIDSGTIPLNALEAMIRDENFRDMPKIFRKYVEEALSNYKNNGDPQNIDITIDKAMYEYMLEKSSAEGFDYVLETVRLMIDITNIKAFMRVKIQDRGREFFKKVFIKGGRLDIDLFLNNMTDTIENFPNKIYHTDHFKWVKEGVEEYVKSRDLGSIEKYGDDFLINFIKKTKLMSFGPEPVIAYIISRENEIKLLRIILTGKMNNVSPDLIRERLRDTYV